MKNDTIQQPPPLLADPEQIAVLRDLYAHARSVRAQHHIYSFGDGHGQAYGPKEHTWTVGTSRVLVHDGWLVYLSHGVPLLKVTVDNVRQVGQLLAAIGVLPPRFASAYRICRHCAGTGWDSTRHLDVVEDHPCGYCNGAGGAR